MSETSPIFFQGTQENYKQNNENNVDKFIEFNVFYVIESYNEKVKYEVFC